MTDTQERVEINQITNNQRFGFSRRLLKSFIAREWFTYWVIAVVVVIGALYHHHSIYSLEARFERTVEKMLDKREKKSRAFVEEAVKITETNMARKLETRFETGKKILAEREKGSRAFIEAAVKTSETNMAGKFDTLRRLLETRFETVEKMLDEREKGSRAFIEVAVKTSETNMAGKFDTLRRLLVHKNCAEVYKSGRITSGVYTINPDGIGPDSEVFCDQKTAGGGWTVVQKRLDGSVDFDRGWSDYKNGFGDLNSELWLGLDKMHRLTKPTTKLRVDLEDFDGHTYYAEFDVFSVADESKKYQLSVMTYSGTAGDSLTQHHGYSFSTKGQDNDSYDRSCAEMYEGGWWYANCYYSNLNGVYRHAEESANDGGVDWNLLTFPNSSLKRAEMKIRPVDF